MLRNAQARFFVTGLLFLTASTGAIDTVSYLALDRVFTGNMTGNVLFLGFALVGVDGIPFVNNAIALVGFVIGSIIGGRLVGAGGPKTLPRVAAFMLASGAVLILVVAVLWLSVGELSHPLMLTVTAVLAVVMGAQVAAVKPIGNSDVTTVVVTNTLANLARESRLGNGVTQAWLQRLLAVICMGLGAVVGASAIALWGGPGALMASVVIYAAGMAFLLEGSRRAA